MPEEKQNNQVHDNTKDLEWLFEKLDYFQKRFYTGPLTVFFHKGQIMKFEKKSVFRPPQTKSEQ